MEKLNFSVENISAIADSEDPNFCNISIDVFASGQNAHNMPVSDDVLMSCSESIYDVPIVWRYDSWTDDAGGHDPEEQICGFIGRPNNPINFRRLPDGRLMMSVLGKLWKRYSGKLMDILKRDGGKKAVSVEMDILDFDKIKSEIKNFAMRAVTVIGVEPAIPDAGLTVLSFSKDKENYYNKFENKKTYKIDLSKESAFMNDEKYSNPGRQLYGKMISAANSKELVDAGYLIVENGWETSPSTKLKYPVTKWRCDTLCLSKPALEAANSRMQAQHVTGEPLNKLKRYYKKLGMPLESFSTDFTEKEENKLEDKVMMEETPKEPETKEENPKAEPEKTEPEKEEPKKEFEQEPEEVDYAVKFADLEKKFTEQEKELFELRKFKADVEERDKNYAVEQLMSDVSDSLPKEKMEEFRDEAKELKLSEFAAFSNKVKACTLDFVKKIPSKDNLVVMATSLPEKAEKKNVWGF